MISIIISSLESYHILFSTYDAKQNHHPRELLEHTELFSCKNTYSKYGIPSEIFQTDITYTIKLSDDMWLHCSGMAEWQQCANLQTFREVSASYFTQNSSKIEKNERDLFTATTLHPVPQSNLMQRIQTQTVPDRLRGELVGVSFPPETGETCQVVTGGGVSHELPDADRRRCPPPGGVPIIN
jgi:hypothetical protein